MLLITDGRRVLLERQPAPGIWGGLLSLPASVGETAEAFALRHGCRLLTTQKLPPVTHTFTHFRLTIEVLRCTVEVTSRQAMEAIREWLPLENVATAALPAPIKKLLLSSVCG